MKRLILGFILLGGLCNTSYSQWSFSQGKVYLGAHAGVTFPKVDNNYFVSSGFGWPDDEYKIDGAGSTGVIGVGIGYTVPTCQAALPFLSLGASYTYAAPSKVSGEVIQYSLPQFINYNYQYKIERQTFLAVLKADFYRYRNLMPYLTLGAGVSLNNASNYDETDKPNVTARVSPGFSGETSTSFSYMIGAGIDYIVCDNLWLGLEYNYGYFGYAQTGHGIQGFGYADANLKTRFSSNTVALTLNYFFDRGDAAA